MIIKEIDYVLAIHQYGSITTAADRLFITQSALSKYLQSLEERLGFKLFARKNNKLSLTEEGELYIRFANHVTDERKVFLMETEELRKKKSDIYVGIGLILESIRFRDIMDDFKKLHPNSNIYLNSQRNTQNISSIKDGKISFFFGYPPDDEDTDHLVFEPIFQDELLVAIPESHPAARCIAPHPVTSKPYIDLRTLQKEQFIMQSEQCWIRRFILKMFEDLQFSPDISTYTNSTYAALNLVSKGLGIALCAYSMMGSFPNIRFATVDDDSHSIPNGVIYRRDKPLTRLERDFIDIFSKYNKNNTIGTMQRPV